MMAASSAGIMYRLFAPRAALSMSGFRRRDRGLSAEASAQPEKLAVVQARQGQLRDDRSDQRVQHVPLRVPDVALRSQKIVRRGPADHGRPPLDELVARADRQADAADDEEQPAARAQRRAAEQHFARDDRGHEALREMTDAVVVVAREVEQIAHPE